MKIITFLNIILLPVRFFSGVLILINKLILWAANNPKKEESQMVLRLTEELEYLKKELNKYKVVAYARINDHGDLFDLRLQNNPFIDQNLIVKLYAKLED